VNRTGLGLAGSAIGVKPQATASSETDFSEVIRMSSTFGWAVRGGRGTPDVS